MRNGFVGLLHTYDPFLLSHLWVIGLCILCFLFLSYSSKLDISYLRLLHLIQPQNVTRINNVLFSFKLLHFVYSVSIRLLTKTQQMAAAMKSSSPRETTSITLPHNNLETYSLLWPDDSINSQQNLDTQQKLRSSINYLITFEQSDQCEQHIRSASSQDRIVLIVSDRLGQQVVPRIHQLRQISSIYVYCIDEQRNQQWANQFNKVN